MGDWTQGTGFNAPDRSGPTRSEQAAMEAAAERKARKAERKAGVTPRAASGRKWQPRAQRGWWEDVRKDSDPKTLKAQIQAESLVSQIAALERIEIVADEGLSPLDAKRQRRSRKHLRDTMLRDLRHQLSDLGQSRGGRQRHKSLQDLRAIVETDRRRKEREADRRLAD